MIWATEQLSLNSSQSTMVGENLEIHTSQMAKNELKQSTMVGEKFDIHMSQMAKNELT